MGSGGTDTWCVAVIGADSQGALSQPATADEMDADGLAADDVAPDAAGEFDAGLLPLEPHPATTTATAELTKT
jgi:hypothetical protein